MKGFKCDMNQIKIDLAFWNKTLKGQTPDDIINWALNLTENRIVTTSFGVYSAILLSTIAKHDPDMKVVWCDTLFNEPETYQHADYLIQKFNLKVFKYEPLKSRKEIDEEIGLPGVEDEAHAAFSEVVNLNPLEEL